MMGDMDLNGLAEKGFVRFSIRAEDTEENKAVHLAFKDFCRAECDNNYTIGLRVLLQYYERDFKFEMLWDKIAALEEKLLKMEEKKVEKSEEKGGMF